MLILGGILVATPAIGFVSNCLLCKLFPMWGNYITLVLAAGAGTTLARCIAQESDGSRKTEIDNSLRLLFGSAFGFIVTFLLSLPVCIKIGIAIVVKIVGLLVSYSDT